MSRVVVAFLVATAVAGAVRAAPVEASRSGLVGFQMPSRNIACGYLPRARFGSAYLRCDVRSGLRPEPRGRCDGDWTGASLNPTGRGHAVCAGDTVFDPRYPVLRYGRTWRRGGFTCVSRTIGLRCTNRRGHGFFLARERWRVF